VRAGSIRADFETCLRTAVFTLRLDPFRVAFLVPFREAVFAGLAFKWTNLPRVSERLDAFFIALAFVFAFVTIDAATYTGSSG
jgi:hypothetical protein